MARTYRPRHIRKARHARPKQHRELGTSVARYAAIGGAVTVSGVMALNVLPGGAGEAALIPVAQPPAHSAFTTAAQTPTHYIVRSGDTLSRIAKRTLGSAKKWPVLWWANRHAIRNPNAILAGQRLVIPTSGHLTARISRKAYGAIPPPPPPAPVAVASAPAPSSQSPSSVTQQSAPAPTAVVSYTGGSGFQACVIARESGGNPSAVNPSSGAGGLYGFLPSTWQALGFSGSPQNASVATQNAAFAKEYAQSGTSPWAPYDGC